ncbi:MAG: type IV pilus secretin PilQ, partial [Acidobacteriota bacterium]|nr:type IV pilus secretin PilQ [Acidobacteriota bacterium]
VETEEIGAHRAQTRGEPAHALEEIRATPGKGEVTVTLLGDGTFSPRTFALGNPPRVVIDLPGVKNEVRKRAIMVASGLVSRIRVSQFATSPEMVTRIVLDLSRPLPHVLRADGERLAVVVGEGASRETVAASGAPRPRAPAPSRTEIAGQTQAQAQTQTASFPPADMPAAPPVQVGQTRPSDPGPAQPLPAAPSGTTTSMTTTTTEAAPAPPQEAPAMARESKSEPAPAAAEAAPIERTERPASAPPPQKAAVAVKETTLKARADEAIRAAAADTSKPTSGVRPSRKVSKTAVKTATPREEALFEGAAAMLAQEEGARPEGTAAQAASFQPRTISETQTQFTGEPISLDLKDADIKDVFRTISQLTQLNIVVDPEVRGTVTVQLEDVPWDQALDLILKQNSLGYVLENNIMRIATTQKLQSEQSDRARLAEARQAAEPTRTLIKKLSYARAAEITPTIKSVMSKRGDIVVDTRTNTLIIREIPTYLPAVLQLIDQLDTATPQVMIESRIVETTKSLGRSLGINWGANAVADVAHGNTTNLVFPNTIAGLASVPLGIGPTVASIRLGNILDTFNLDIALSAAENQGLLKIISSPKVAALTNTAASIQSGVQIPVQTNVNNTTTVIYVDATLRLTVTPQITNEGTILLDVQVSKREPAVALNLSLGNNVPLTIREYKGQILVRDGGTTVIGGIFQINDQDQNNMIPGLWKIPILGNLFRNKTRTEKHDELLIFITPRILRS